MNDPKRGHKPAPSETEIKPKMASGGPSASSSLATGPSQNGTTPAPAAAYQGELLISDISIPCFVLDDNRRVLSGRGITGAMALKGRGSGTARFATAKYLQPFLSDSLRHGIENPIQFSIPGGLPNALGYEAIVLPELCNAIQDAADADLLRDDQLPMARQAKILSRALSTVGIIGLIDEATGYQ